MERLSTERIEDTLRYHKATYDPDSQLDHYIMECLEELKAYKDAENQGLLLKLPCKPGDTIYLLKYWVGDWKIEPYTVKTLGYVLQLIENELIGELAFLTPEEAERELKNRQK